MILQASKFNFFPETIRAYVLDLLSKSLYAVIYNTTFVVNLMLTMGVVSPFAIIQLARHNLPASDLFQAILIMFVTTYCYNVVYIINDFIDRRKDAALNIPKFTAYHRIGKYYLYAVTSCFTGIILYFYQLVPVLIVPVSLYVLTLSALSLVHSQLQSSKLVTIFLERFAKFFAPLVMVYLGTGNETILPMIMATLLLFPLSHTMDYAYRGYISERLDRMSSIRFVVYSSYYCAVLVAFILAYTHQLHGFDITASLTFIIVYGVTSISSDVIATKLPLRFLDNRYVPHVANEKRRLLAYGFIQVIILIIGGIYANYH